MTTMASNPADPHTHALDSQVGGHAGVNVTEDGSLLIKPALHHELEFYQAIQQDPKLAWLREYTPKFFGMLKLEGTLADLAPGKVGEGGLGIPLLSQEPEIKQKDMCLFRFFIRYVGVYVRILNIYSRLCWRTFRIHS